MVEIKLDTLGYARRLQVLEGKLGSIEERLEAKIGSLAEHLDGKLGSLEARLDGKLSSLEARLNGKINLLFWSHGLLVAVILLPNLKNLFH